MDRRFIPTALLCIFLQVLATKIAAKNSENVV